MGFYIKQGEGEKIPFVLFFFFALLDSLNIATMAFPYCCYNKESTTLLDLFHFF
jgi:hypothetical protein